MSVDYYAMLGVHQQSQRDEIKRAYRQLARKWHPDRNPGNKDAEETFKQITEAYETLMDDDKRRQYDQMQQATAYGASQQQAWAAGPGSTAAGGYGQYDAYGAAAAGGAYSAAGKGQDVYYDVSIALEEAYTGARRDLEIPKMMDCATCAGTGAYPGTPSQLCIVCNGLGQIKQVESRGGQRFVSAQHCPRCQGRGRLMEYPCGSCNGRAKTRQSRVLKITIPPGVESGTNLRLQGEGEEGPAGGVAGDVYIRVTVPEHQRFKRDGANLVLTEYISFAVAALGGEIDVQTLVGPVRVAVPAATQTDTQLRLRGKGMPSAYGQAMGDLLIRLVVITPTDLTDWQRNLLAEYARARGDNVSVKASGFLGLRR